MKVREAMSSPVATCHPTTSLAAAGLEMLRHDCGVLPVVEEGRGVVGIITDRDICTAVSTRMQNAHELRVGSAMTTTLHCVGPDDDLVHALEVMSSGRVHRLPVIDGAWRLVGILSINDVVLLSGAAEPREHGPSCDQVLTTLRGIHAHWRPHVLDRNAVHPIVPPERHTHPAEMIHEESLPPVAPHAEPELEQLEPLEHTAEFDWEE